MTPSDRTTNTTHPQYLAGTAAANRALDRSGTSARDEVANWELIAQQAHEREDVGRYHYAAGVVAVYRDYLEERAR